MLYFNDLLRKANIDPSDVILMKHKDLRADPDRTPYILWRSGDPDFDLYQARQNPQKSAILRKGKNWAVFIDTPADETVFVGLYQNTPRAPNKGHSCCLTLGQGIVCTRTN